MSIFDTFKQHQAQYQYKKRLNQVTQVQIDQALSNYALNTERDCNVLCLYHRALSQKLEIDEVINNVNALKTLYPDDIYVGYMQRQLKLLKDWKLATKISDTIESKIHNLDVLQKDANLDDNYINDFKNKWLPAMDKQITDSVGQPELNYFYANYRHNYTDLKHEATNTIIRSIIKYGFSGYLNRQFNSIKPNFVKYNTALTDAYHDLFNKAMALHDQDNVIIHLYLNMILYQWALTQHIIYPVATTINTMAISDLKTFLSKFASPQLETAYQRYTQNTTYAATYHQIKKYMWDPDNTKDVERELLNIQNILTYVIEQ